MTIAIPLFLQPEKLSDLNRRLWQKTGCFAFLHTDQCLPLIPPTSYTDAFLRFTIGLYAIYHDFGKNFLWFMLDRTHTATYYPNHIIQPHKSHVNLVTKVLRANIAHGVYDIAQRQKFQDKLSYQYFSSSTNTNQWPDYYNTLTEKQWEVATLILTKDADKLYHYLDYWCSDWCNQPKSLPALQAKFVNELGFENSFDQVILKQLMRKYNATQMQINSYLNMKNSTAQIHQWRNTLKSCYSNGMHDPEQLYEKLEQIIKSALQPAAQSSNCIATQYGFGIPHI